MSSPAPGPIAGILPLNEGRGDPITGAMLPESLAPPQETLPPQSARVSIAPRRAPEASVSYSVATDVGRKRQHNEDSVYADPSLPVFVVCDGMGGHAAGEVASRVAIEVFCSVLSENRARLHGYMSPAPNSEGGTKRDVVQVLQLAVQQASRAVFAQAVADPQKRGMGTTLVAVVLLGNHAFVTHVGDSRVYLLRDGSVEQLTRDHNVYNDLVLARKLSPEAAEIAAPKSAITRAVGVYEHCQPDTIVVDIAAGDRLLLCSDGLSDYFDGPVGEFELAAMVAQPDSDAAVQELIAAANARGGKDNISALVVTVGTLGEHDAEHLARLEQGRRALSQSRMFELLDERQVLQVLELTETFHYRAGQVIVELGERGDAMFVVLTGAVDVVRGDLRVAHLHSGDHFGEMALVRERPRSAQVIAAQDTELLAIPIESLYELLQADRDLGMRLMWSLTRVLADRLAQTTYSWSQQALEDCAAWDAGGSPSASPSPYPSPYPLVERLHAPGQLVELHDDDEDRRPTVRPPPAFD